MSNRIPVLKGEIAGLSREVEGHLQNAAEKALTLGAALCEAKELCKHGKWSGFLKECGVSSRSAQRYMRLHNSGIKCATVADLGFAAAEYHSRLIELANMAGDDSIMFWWQRPNEGYEHSIFWQYAPGAFFVMGFRTPPIEEGMGFKVMWKKPLDVLDVAMVHERMFPGMGRVEDKKVIPDQEARWWAGGLGIKVVGHAWGTRLEWMDPEERDIFKVSGEVA